MLFRQIVDEALSQYAYLIGCQSTGEALLIDPERDVDRYLELIAEEGLRLTAVTETHIHADFLSGTRELAHREPSVTVYLSAEGGPDWSYAWAEEIGERARLLTDGDVFRVGGIEVRAVHTPGHTPEHLSFLVTDRGGGASEPMGLVSGDFVFVGDLGRPDLLDTAAGVGGTQEPSARRLYASAGRFLELADHLQLWPGHGAGSACGKALGAVPTSTVGYERRHNPALDAVRRGEDAFVRSILAGQPEPPLYFARMKRLNRQGPPLLGPLPEPANRKVEELAALAGDAHTVVVDTRPAETFFAGHLAGSLLAPLDRSFPTVTGSFVEPGQTIHLVVEEEALGAAVRALVRIGLDEVAGYATPAEIATYGAGGGSLATLETIGFAELERRRHRDGVAVLDVRGSDEHAGRSIPGSRNIPHTRLRSRLDELPPADELLVHCAAGARSAVSTALLARHGHPAVAVLGPFTEWQPEKQAASA